MRISMVWDWPPVLGQVSTWEDGLAAALRELEKRGHELQVFMPGPTDYTIYHYFFDIQVCTAVDKAVEKYDPDVILMWGDMTRPNAKPLKALKKPMAVCFAGGNADGENAPLFDHIFVESQVYYDQLKEIGYDVSIAFGTNTDLFTPIPQAKVFDTIFPATFAAWKRHDLYARATNGLKSLAVGYMYHDHEQECWQECVNNNVMIMPHTSAQALKYLYAASKVCVVTSRSDGGSQRTILEAMAMNLPVITCDSDKYDWATQIIRISPDASEIRHAIEQHLDDTPNTREFILENLSHIQYADALEKGLQSICA